MLSISLSVQLLDMGFFLFFLFFGGIRGGRGYLAEADLKVLYGSGHWGTLVIDRIKIFPRGTSCGRDGLRAQHIINCSSGAVVAISDELVSSITQVLNLFLDRKCPKMLGEYIASAPLTPLVKSGGGIHPIAVGTI
nr:putative reverse transcriptase domain-containing protein [Tanacetum cinerariifolium]